MRGQKLYLTIDAQKNTSQLMRYELLQANAMNNHIIKLTALCGFGRMGRLHSDIFS